MVILITGGSGNLGSELKNIFKDCLCPIHNELDITNKTKVNQYFQNHEITTIIHTAAMTKIRSCEENKELSWKTNVKGTQNLVDAASQLKNAPKFVYISTACVFDGKLGMYKESDLPYPENFYALTKLLGEIEVKKLKDILIIRTNFVAKKPWPYPKAFTDRFGTYLFAENVAFGIKEVIDSGATGTIHVVGDKKISMFDLAKKISPFVKSMTMDDYQGPPLTMDMSLDTQKWKKYTLK
jgi:dTDP-4-dehydrorhamnose reductase